MNQRCWEAKPKLGHSDSDQWLGKEKFRLIRFDLILDLRIAAKNFADDIVLALRPGNSYFADFGAVAENAEAVIETRHEIIGETDDDEMAIGVDHLHAPHGTKVRRDERGGEWRRVGEWGGLRAGR